MTTISEKLASASASAFASAASKSLTATYTLAVGVILNDRYNERAAAEAIMPRRVFLATVKATLTKRNVSLATIKRAQDDAMTLAADYKDVILTGIAMADKAGQNADPTPAEYLAAGVAWLATTFPTTVALAEAVKSPDKVKLTEGEKHSAKVASITKWISTAGDVEALEMLGKLATTRAIVCTSIKAGDHDAQEIISAAAAEAKLIVANILAAYGPAKAEAVAEDDGAEDEAEAA